MAAISPNVLMAMRYNVTLLFNRMMCLSSFEMTHEECLELIAPPEHLEILRSAAKYADVMSSESWMDITVPGVIDGTSNPHAALLMRTHGGKTPPLKPREPQWNADKPGAAKVSAWLKQALYNGRMAGLTIHIVEHLSHRCDTGAQVRFMWPCVLLLCKKLPDSSPYSNYSERMEAWASKNSPFKPQKSVPSLSGPMRQALKDTSGWITAASLLSPDLKGEPHGEVSAFYGHSAFDFEGYTLSRLSP